MNQEVMLNRIAVLLSRFSESVRILNANGEFSINVHAENALIQLLNVIFDCEFENVNYSERKSYPSIDLRDKQKRSETHKRIAIQVTSDESLAKVKDCLTKFLKKGLDKDFDVLYVVMLVRKQNSYSKDSIDRVRKSFPFSSSKHILDLKDLYVMLNAKNDLNAIGRVLKYLEVQFSDPVDYDKHWTYCSDLADYDQSIVRQHMYIDVSGYAPQINTRQVRVGIKDLYVSQILQTAQDDKTYESPISRLLMPEEKSVILGDPGSGKSTLLKWLMYDICANRDQYSTEIPVYVKCASFAQKLMNDQMDLGAYILDTLNTKNRQVYLQGLASGYLVLLLDGLDEISNVSLRHDVADSINVFIAQNPGCRVIATSRKIGYNETCLNAHFTHYELLPFNKDQILEFVRNWFKAVDEEQYDENQVKKFVRKLISSRDIMDLAETPLLLMIICLIQHQGISLPENRIELYSIATGTLLDNWVQRRSRYSKGKVSIRLLKSLLSPVAFYMQENCEGGIITEETFRDQMLEVYRKKARNKSDIEIDDEVDSLINYIKTDAGFLREVGIDWGGSGKFSFIHLTFQEYFAAIRMASKWQRGMDLSELRDYVLAPHWSEVIVLTAEYLYMKEEDSELGSEFVSSFVEQILEIEDSIGIRKRPLELVIRILGSGVELSVDLLKRVIEESCKNGINLIYLIDMSKGIAREMYISELLSQYRSSPTDDYLVDVMMRFSDEAKIQEELTRILTGQDFEAQKKLFSYSVVYPVAPISHTDLFRESITRFVNSQLVEDVPTQYTISHVIDTDHTGTASQVISAIKAINDEKLRQEYAEDVFRAVLWKDVDEKQALSDWLKTEMPEVNCSDLDQDIAEEQLKNSIERSTQDSVDLIKLYQGFSMYYSVERSSLTVNLAEQVFTFNSPYEFSELSLPNIGDMREFNRFICIVIRFIEKTHVQFETFEEFELYTKYSDLLNWDATDCYSERNGVFDYFFSHFDICMKNVRQYLSIFRFQWYNKAYSMDSKGEKLDKIIRSSLSMEEKVKVLACLEIPRKYRKQVHDVIAEYLKNGGSQDWEVRNAVNYLVNCV